MSEPVSLESLVQKSFRPTKDANEFLDNHLHHSFPGERWRRAQLAIARSIHEPTTPEPIAKGTEFALGIPGHTLFQAEKAIWACLIAESWPSPVDTPEVFKAAVEAHWHRGAELLRADLAEARDELIEFAIALASRAGLTGGAPWSGSPAVRGATGEHRVSIHVGQVSIALRENASIEFALNESGHSPHLAIMGKIRSGKTRTGLDMAEEIVRASKVPILFIDPKGEFVKDGAFVAKNEWGGRTFADRFPGAQPLDVGRTPVPLDFVHLTANAAPNQSTNLGGMFKDSFQRCIRARGDVALNNLREVVIALLNAQSALRGTGVHSKPISLRAIRDALRERNEEEDRARDSLDAKLSELVDLNLFDPKMSPTDFFGRSWVIGLGSTPEEAKRLVIFLVLDALTTHVIAEQDAPTDTEGHRKLQHLLVVDEAREVLAYKHPALSQLIRKAGSKGEVVMLLSQSPEDFDAEEDDFLAQMGTVAVFASSTQSVKSLRAVMGKKLRPEELADAALPKGTALVKLPGREPMKILAWRDNEPKRSS